MASLKKLSGQTAWYGLSSILARMLQYLLTPVLTYYLTTARYGEMSAIYAVIPFLNVIFTYGMETTFFRFSNKGENEGRVFNTAGLSLFFTTLLLASLLVVFRAPMATLLRVENHPQFIIWVAWIIALDTLSTLPFAKLRNDGRPRKYAFIKVTGIAVNVALTIFFYAFLPRIAAQYPQSFLASWYDPNLGAGYVIIANVVMSALVLLLLTPEILSLRLQFDKRLWKQMMVYSLPIMIAGFAGMINETFDRIMLGWWAPGNEHYQIVQVGIYSACYKLSLLITLFIQAFRLGAEPFFFHQAKEEGEGAKKTYARVMKFFVITICGMFLFVMLYIDIWKHFISKPEMWEGLTVVPILLIANMCLGVYYNLSIWYKLSHSTRPGATITLIGAVLTLIINFCFIPRFGYMACAWATLICYASMMLISFFWGQKVYPVPYNVKKLLSLFGVMLLFYGVDYLVTMLTPNLWLHFLAGSILFLTYVRFIIKIEIKELRAIPMLARFLK